MLDLPILLVDDEPQVRSFVKTVLLRQGFRVVEADDGLAACSLIQDFQGRFSLVVSDIGVPHLDGATLSRWVKEQFPSIPILLLSGGADPNSLVQQLRVAEQPAQDGKQMAYLRLDSEAKAQPMVAAKNTAQFKHGEAAQVLKERGDWVLVVGQDNKTGWVESQAIAVQATAQAAFDMAVEKIIRQLQKMRAKYSQGPVVLSGFTIDVKFPPGASVEFGFK